MKTLKALLAALSVTALTSTAMACESSSNRAFAGIEGGMGWNTFDLKRSQPDEITAKENNVKSKFIGGRVGTYLQDIFRVYATFSWNMLDDTTLKYDIVGTAKEAPFKDLKQMNFLLSGDYIFMPESQFHPFIGLTLGATQNKLKTRDEKSYDKWGLAYGAQAGVLFPLESLDLELGVRYLGNNATIENSSISENFKTDMTHSKQVYLALSLRF
ncbi:MAG: outer membrane beta-barrel protein [Endozoicomonas sp.]